MSFNYKHIIIFAAGLLCGYLSRTLTVPIYKAFYSNFKQHILTTESPLRTHVSEVKSTAPLPSTISSLYSRSSESIQGNIELFNFLENANSIQYPQILNEFTQGLSELRFSQYEWKIFSDWMSRKNPSEAMNFLTTLPESIKAHYQIEQQLITDLATQHFPIDITLLKKSEANMQSYVKGLVAGNDTEKINELLKQDEFYFNGVIIPLKMNKTLRESGYQSFRKEFVQSKSTTTSPEPNTWHIGSNVFKINEYFNISTVVDSGSFDQALQTIKETEWYGRDNQQTQVALNKMAELDSAQAMKEAESLMISDPKNAWGYLSGTFAHLVTQDTPAALDYLKKSKLSEGNLQNLLNTLYVNSKDDQITRECTEIMTERNWKIPSSVISYE
jgi:hypothetical protein